MPVSASRPPPVNISSSLLDDHCPPRRSSPPFSKLTDPRPSPPSPRTPSSLPSPKSVLSPRTEKKVSLSSPSAAEEKKLEKSGHTSSPPSDSRTEPPSAVDSRPREDEESDAGDGASALGSGFPKFVDGETFNQILDLDEDDEHEFSQQMVQEFYTQAETTFTEMDALYKEKQLATLSDKGHFLKGSSAAIGLSMVRESCEEIQNYGNLRNKANEAAITREEALKLIGEVLTRVRVEYEEVKTWLEEFFATPGP
ncbi:Multistep phosphorelay regulator 1 [Leucoagaricus sp. SymC.cos]|nr:Multistep phosphorelay regulator 1 [Leucoagaricus sp. SymC.cos]